VLEILLTTPVLILLNREQLPVYLGKNRISGIPGAIGPYSRSYCIRSLQERLASC